ncbi:acyl-CoA dehydrogenase family protein [Neptunicoccus cionae]|uniref:acyl-CoA dehydrogenase family protein n=1 Tax=Neptunicoccus cionae TaxID=2035344 RepID=UPI000C758A04|nr:acyl-CoA dehydrogenase family protein [Amylibacter cionae]PLS21219.1 pilus assembly protein CpaB [Amylibacter cionae]
MDISQTDEQKMLQDSVTRLLERSYDFEARQKLLASGQPWSPDTWQSLAEMGILGLPISEESGGFGGSMADIVSIAEPFGAHLLIEPFVSSILLGGQCLAHGEGPAAEAQLARILTGEQTAAFAHEEGRGTADPALVSLAASESDGGFTLNGEKRMVLGGAQADVLVVSARARGAAPAKDGLSVFMVDPDQKGVRIKPFVTIDGRHAAHITFDGVRIPAARRIVAEGYDVLEQVISKAIIALCAEAVGAMGALLRLTGEYASTRKQFGTPIAAFQTISHRLADMKIAYVKARSNLLYTTALKDAGHASPLDVSVLKGQIGTLGRQIGEAAIQTHGGVGMTDEISIGHFHKRILAINALFGDSEYHFRAVGQSLASS